MANLRGAPSWVQVQPTDFSGALLKGFQTGMSLADMQNKIQESNAQRAMEAQKQSEAAALSQWETQQRMELEREKLAQQAANERAQQAALDQWRQGQLENQALANAIDEKRLAETVRYNTGRLNEPNVHFGKDNSVLQTVIDPTTGQPTVKVLREADTNAGNVSPSTALNLVSDPLKSALLESAIGSSGVSNLVNIAKSGVGIKSSPSAGTIYKGYRFLGGNPRLEANWEKVQ